MQHIFGKEANYNSINYYISYKEAKHKFGFHMEHEMIFVILKFTQVVDICISNYLYEFYTSYGNITCWNIFKIMIVETHCLEGSKLK